MKTFSKFQIESNKIINAPSQKLQLTYPQFAIRFKKLLCLVGADGKKEMFPSCSFDKDENKTIRAAFNIYKKKFEAQADAAAAANADKEKEEKETKKPKISEKEKEEKETKKPKISEATVKPNPYFNYSLFKERHLEMYPGTDEAKIKAAFEKYKMLAPPNIEESRVSKLNK